MLAPEAGQKLIKRGPCPVALLGYLWRWNMDTGTTTQVLDAMVERGGDSCLAEGVSEWSLEGQMTRWGAVKSTGGHKRA